MNDIVLLCPPMAKPSEPDPALPVLAGHLTALGHPVRIVDANLRYQEEITRRDFLQSCIQRLDPQTVSSSALTAGHRAVFRAEESWKTLSRPEGYADPARYRAHLGILTEAGRLVSRAHGMQLTLSDFVHPALSPLCTDDLMAVTRDSGLLPAAEALGDIVEEVLSSRPRLVGVSLSYLSQALFGFALAGLLREAGYGGQLALGGGLVGSWAPQIKPDSPLFSLWDGLAVGPGEEVLAAWADTGRCPDLGEVLSPRNGIWNPSPDPKAGSTSVSFTPDGATLRWRDYLAPAPVLPVSASRGCYWSRCAFCPEAGPSAQPYRTAGIDSLSHLLLDARDRYGIGHVHFTDNALSPAHLRKLAKRLEGEGLRWYGFARLERSLTEPGFMEELAAGGCSMLQLGIETASPRLLGMMGKGTNIERAERIVDNAAAAGIRVYGYFLFGLPTETREEAHLTLDWIRERADRIGFLNLSLMNLPRGGEMEEAPNRFGLKRLAPLDDRNDLSLYWRYEERNQLDRSALRKLLGEARKDPALRKILARTPRGFTANHAAFAPL